MAAKYVDWCRHWRFAVDCRSSSMFIIAHRDIIYTVGASCKEVCVLSLSLSLSLFFFFLKKCFPILDGFFQVTGVS